MKFSLPSWDRRTWVVGFGITLGNVAQSAVPWIVGGLMRSEGYEINRAGLMITAEVMAMGVLMLVTARFVHKMPRRAALFVLTAPLSALRSRSVFSLLISLFSIRAIPPATFCTCTEADQQVCLYLPIERLTLSRGPDV